MFYLIAYRNPVLASEILCHHHLLIAHAWMPSYNAYLVKTEPHVQCGVCQSEHIVPRYHALDLVEYMIERDDPPSQVSEAPPADLHQSVYGPFPRLGGLDQS